MNWPSYLKHSDAFLTCHHSSCPGQKGREGNSVAGPDPARNAGLSGASMCTCVMNARGVRQFTRTQA